jgi:arylsulfatase A-like enzyme
LTRARLNRGRSGHGRGGAGLSYDGCLISRRAFLLTPAALLAAKSKLSAADIRLNVALIVAPGWRGAATPWNSNGTGDADFKAPNLEQFGKSAVVFPRAYACDPQTDPGRAGILTGRYPHANGVTRDGAPLRTEEVTLDSVLKVAGYVAGDSVEWLDSKPDGPFFLNLTLKAPRVTQPADAAKLHVRDNVPAGADASVREELAKQYGVYAALDEQLGAVLAALDRKKLAQNTVVVFTSDCGEQIGSHGVEGNGAWFEESVRVPLAIRHPRAQAFASDVPASQVDIVPTLLALCGEPAFDGLQGRNLSTILLGQKGDRPESVFAEGKLGEKDEWRMLVLGSDKIVVDANGDVTHLYNLADDAYEMTNLAQEPSVKLKRDQLLAIMRATRQRLLDFRRRS